MMQPTSPFHLSDVRFRVPSLAAIVMVLGFCLPVLGQDSSSRLFDGKTLDGWEVPQRDQRWWSVTDGVIAGGSLTENVPHNSFLATQESFQNFDLKLKIRIQGAGGFINSGIQIRSVRVPNSSEMSGYQVDAGDKWWGKLYDESRRNKVIGEPIDPARVEAAVDSQGWNEYRILAEGRRIRSWINGTPALDYQETNREIPLDGHIGIQVHGGGKALVQVKDVVIQRLPSTEDAPTWEKLKRSQAKKKSPERREQPQPLSPKEEQAGFQVPDDFEVELVASEQQGIGKFVTVAFDAQGRMWTMTALEYPVDANENPEASKRLFDSGGQDKVLVFDRPFEEQVAEPRVFADGLVMPLGILPYRDGAYVQYGHDIRFYRDTDGDGQADTHEVILTGFGTQDSHLFPHQFTRTPGGWILTAQGLFNNSSVRRPDGKAFADGQQEILFDQCRLARFTPSGSLFELLTTGPNNIWGLTISREGETWIQEANDLGYPIIPFEPGGYYRTGMRRLLRTYQPLMPPPMSTPQMGGTGLSGLALADDRDGWPAPWGLKNASEGASRIFYLANPITSSIQAISASWDGKRYQYRKLPDFLTSEDPNFRPVAVQFGPDGCLYITDWYNKIISHNEVPRNHPERDKIRGRIWRIRHRSQPQVQPPVLSELKAHELLAHLGGPNARLADLAWQEIVDRGATELVPDLKLLVVDPQQAVDKRLGALWAWEGLQVLPTAVLKLLASDTSPNIRHEAIRIAAAQSRPDAEFLEIASPLVKDPSSRVRAALGDALRRVPFNDPRIVALTVKLGNEPISEPEWDAYDRAFERFLARWAMERNTDQVRKFLDSPAAADLPLENRILATLAVGGKQAARGIAKLIPNLQRPLTSEELQTLTQHFTEPSVAAAMVQQLGNTASRDTTLRTLLQLRTQLDTSRLVPALQEATQTLWRSAPSDAQRQLALEVIGAFQLRAFDRELAEFSATSNTSRPLKLAALGALRGLDTQQSDTLVDIALSETEPIEVRDAAIMALADSTSETAAEALADLLIDLNFEQRQSAVARMATSRRGALVLLDAVELGDLLPEDLSGDVLETMRTLLPDNEALQGLWQEAAGEGRMVLRLSGMHDDSPASPITLTGPFTVETWIRLRPEITNTDGILGAPNVLDMNFYDSTFRVWLANSRNDIVIAKQPITAETWTHLAVTRDAEGVFRIYVNGELSSESRQKNTATFSNLRIGKTIPAGSGTEGELAEYRVWNVARTPRQIRDHFDRSFTEEERPRELAHDFGGTDWGALAGKASVRPVPDGPPLLSVEEAQAQTELFAKFRRLAQQPGDLKNGQAIFTKKCVVCHQFGGQGGKIGPALDGIGLTGTEAILRNVLTPSAAMEGGYRNYRVLTRSGRVVQGLMVSQDATAIVIRQQDTADQRLLKSEIERGGYTSLSVMPNGLLDTLSSEEVSDLFTYLLSLKQNSSASPNAAISSPQQIRHSLLIAGPVFTGILGEDGQVVWDSGRKGARDGFVLKNGNVLLAWNDEVKELTRDGEVVFHYAKSSDNQEIGTVQRLANGNTLITELGKHPRLLEVSPSGELVVNCPLQPETSNAHMQTRMARKLPNGHYLVPHLLAFKVKEYAPDGKMVSELPTDLRSLGGRAAENWPFTAIRLENGNTLVSLTHGNKCVEFTPEGEVAWQVSNDDLPKPLLVDPCGAQRLRNGNTVIASYGAKKGTKILEVNRQKEVVWQYDGPFRAHEIHVLTTNGEAEPSPPLK